ncbi:hypothetical protein LP421_03515 (plasmid) [Rhizobium sp. RCAM05350]|nr:hypothetical protein LP421_03515 [Rhizobium sp. RCAM05350]
METSASDRELIVVMRRYFAAKTELGEIRARLEAARQAAGEDIAAFYDPRSNPIHAGDIVRSHGLKNEMVSLMDRAEVWGRAAAAADREDRSERASPEVEPLSIGRKIDAPSGADT